MFVSDVLLYDVSARKGFISFKQFVQELEDDVQPAEAESRYYSANMLHFFIYCEILMHASDEIYHLFGCHMTADISWLFC